MNRIWLHRRLGDALLGDVSLRPREWDRADGDEHKQVKRASDQMRFDVGVNLFFYFGVCPFFEF
ncbi:MAG: hypothetical protein DME39_08575 [Verrucomicrobia bacterium]|nr:MAG: hypothetical protein DME39_08575 [Verrucomicrobiota bacterium]